MVDRHWKYLSVTIGGSVAEILRALAPSFAERTHASAPLGTPPDACHDVTIIDQSQRRLLPLQEVSNNIHLPLQSRRIST